MTKTAYFVALSLSAIALPQTSFAQTVGPMVDEAPGGRVNQAPKKASIEFVAIEGDGRATLQLQPGKEADLTYFFANGRILKQREEQWSVSFSAPLNKKGNTDLATLDNLSSGFKLEIDFSRSGSKLQAPTNFALDELQRLAVMECDGRGDLGCNDPKNENDVFQRAYLGDRIVDDGMSMHQGSWRWGMTAAIGYDKFNYRDPATLQEMSANKVGVSGSGYFGYLVPNGLTSFTLRAEYQHGYKAGQNKILCPANPTNAVIQCFNDPVGPPQKDKSALLSVDMRHYLGEGLGIPMAIAPLVTYDVNDDVVGVDLPLYLVSDGKLGLSGGLRMGWRSDTKDAVFGIFVGKRFGQW